ncbi:hypothetical protein NHH73_09340 [Oxalobacteraceae bacterium OTU3CINTB1]|nr:hypothetical protein NHH73_09340 [Oxalobacteraceae bacterium OTU3CINTB1]
MKASSIGAGRQPTAPVTTPWAGKSWMDRTVNIKTNWHAEPAEKYPEGNKYY